MSEYVPKKCSHCGESNLHKVKPRVGDKFMIIEIDTAKNIAYNTDGYMLDLYICKQCGIATFTG